MVREEATPALINSVCNTDAVLPFISRHGDAIDWAPAIESEDCIILSNGEDACIVFERVPGTRDWQCNTMFADTCRGKRAVRVGREMRDYMLEHHADMIFGSIPNGFRHAIWFYRQMGGSSVSHIDSGGDRYEPQDGESLFAFRKDPH